MKQPTSPTELFRADVDSRPRNYARLFHFLYAYVNRTWTHAELFGQFGVSGTHSPLGHQECRGPDCRSDNFPLFFLMMFDDSFYFSLLI